MAAVKKKSVSKKAAPKKKAPEKAPKKRGRPKKEPAERHDKNAVNRPGEKVHLDRAMMLEATTTSEGIALLTGVTRESVSRWVKLDGLPREGSTKFALVEAITWYRERLEDQLGGETPEDKKARIAVAKQQELRLKIENATKLNDLIPAELVHSGIAAMGSEFANRLDSLPSRVALELSAMDDPASIQRYLQDECRSIRDSTAAALEAIAGDINSSGDSQTAAE